MRRRKRAVPIFLLSLTLLLLGCSLHGGSGSKDRLQAATERGFDRLSEGEWWSAMGAFHDALDIDADHAPARYGLGRVFVETGFWSGAEEELGRAIEIRPGYGEAYLGLATLYYRMGRYGAAERNVLEAEKKGAGGSPRALHLLGLFAVRRGDQTEAEERFREGLRLAPADTDLRLALVDLLREQARYSEALHEIERERFTRGKEDDVRLRLADCRLHMGQDLEAERLYSQLALSRRHDRRAHEGLVLLSLRRGDAESTREHLLALAGLLANAEAERIRDLSRALESNDPFFSFLVRCRDIQGEVTGDLRVLIGRWIRELERKSP
ncbi:MAG: tetratricopeptide repeat protein [Candidatus Eisenbacteria bacterium]